CPSSSRSRSLVRRPRSRRWAPQAGLRAQWDRRRLPAAGRRGGLASGAGPELENVRLGSSGRSKTCPPPIGSRHVRDSSTDPSTARPATASRRSALLQLEGARVTGRTGRAERALQRLALLLRHDAVAAGRIAGGLEYQRHELLGDATKRAAV